MPHFLFRWQLKDAAVKGLVTRPQNRGGPAGKLFQDFGGTMHHYFFTFTEHDGFAIGEFPDATGAGSLTMAARATGSFDTFEMVRVFTPEEAEQMMQKAHDVGSGYSPPGA